MGLPSERQALLAELGCLSIVLLPFFSRSLSSSSSFCYACFASSVPILRHALPEDEKAVTCTSNLLFLLSSLQK